MGLEWSSPKIVKSGTLIIISSNFPEGERAKEEIWNLWKLKKDIIKKDGFGLSKDKGCWKINYYHTVNDNTYEKTVSKTHMWEYEFNEKLKKWERALKEIHDFMDEKIKSEVIEDS